VAASPLIQLRNVAKRFEARGRAPLTAVSDITFDVPAGSFLAVVGPSGCGKSTLLALVCGLSPVSEGDITVHGRPVLDVQQNMGFLFQRDALLPWKTVLDNVMLPLVFRGRSGDARQQADNWVRRVGLAGFEQYYPHQLSGGMRKRVALAQTLVYQPEILLMDEPFSALDVQTRNLMENELLDLWAEDRKTVIFITHDLEEAIALSDEVLVMTASPGRLKARYEVDLPRPRNVTEIRFHPRFPPLYERIWADLRDEVMVSYERSKAQ
jgi:NitT/TauT family transport system ATP-binding protein